MGLQGRKGSQTGFTLLEVMIAILVLTVGVVGLAAMLASSLTYMSMSQVDYLAQQKAAEAVESIFTARDLGSATWNSICNTNSAVCSAGIFFANAQPVCEPGPDGIVDTADDYVGTACAVDDAILLPGTTGTYSSSPVRMSLSRYNFQRTITISNVLNASGNVIDNLRQITVNITYQSGKFPRSYTLTTDISDTL